ncbi:MAG: toprim domain-containing protein [Gammaproteobacteria bacterium]|nr:toprim domain-containing protein [Gammaproteobacteria bacterium]
MNWLDSLQFEMSAHGLAPRDGIIANGAIQRFHVAGDKPGSLNGWYVVHGDSRPTAIFGSWKTGERHVWHAELPRSDLDRREQRDRIARERQRREADREAAQRDAARRAADVWNTAREPHRAHRYLRGKAISAHGIRQLGAALIVPLCDADGQIWNLQFIDGDGAKRFLRGGRVKGLFYAIGERTPRIWICEGLATGASLHDDTGECVIVTFSAGNLLPAGLAMQRAWRPPSIAIVGDDDHRTEGNPGATAAAAAAKQLGGTWCLPEFPAQRPEWATDFNDAARLWRAGRAAG